MNTPTEPLEALRQDILTEFKQVLKLAPADYTENCTNVVMSMVKDLIHTREQQARIDELETASDTFDNMHQKTDGGGFVHYGEFGEYLDDRIATLKEEQV